MIELLQKFAFSVVLPFCFFGGLAGITVFVIWLVVPDIDEFVKRLGLDLGYGLYEEEKLPAVREHRQATVGICTNGKFENPNMDYNTEERHLQEV